MRTLLNPRFSVQMRLQVNVQMRLQVAYADQLIGCQVSCVLEMQTAS